MARLREASGGPQRAADLLDALMGGPLGQGLGPAQRAARAWHAANGDRERAHTTGVWLRKPGRAGMDPVLVVALDSNLLAGELGTNKDLYLTRLAMYGVHVSDIRFTVRRADHTPAAAGRDRAGGPAARVGEAPPLSPAELARVDRATAALPDGLRQSVSRAMCASLRRSKGKHSQEA